MTKLLTSIFALCVALATASAQAQDAKGNADVGAKAVAMCVGCHGIIGYQASFPEIYKVPKIAGQSATYIKSALTAYRAGDRKHPTMGAIATSLSDKDIADLAAYYSQLGLEEGNAPPATVQKEPGDAVQALISRDANNSCTKCHGANFNTPNDGTVPKLAGQYSDYLYAALKAYKTEGHARWGRANAVMGGNAKKFSNDELKTLASYISALPGEIKTVPESRFHFWGN